MSREVRQLARAGAAAGAILAVSASSAAAVQSKTLNYQCKYPLIGVRPLSVKIDLNIPNSWPAGQSLDPIGITATASASDMSVGLGAVQGLTAIQGAATAFATVKTSTGFSVPAKTVATIEKTPISKPVPNPLVLKATGQTPALTFDEQGSQKIVLDKLAINLVALNASGQAIALPPVTKDIDGNAVSDSDGNAATFDVYCKLGDFQDTTLGTIRIGGTGTPAPTAPPVQPTPTPTIPRVGGSTTAKLSYTLQGSTQINTLTKGSMPLTGTIDATLNTATAEYTATTVINDTQGRLSALGFLPVTVAIAIVPSGPTVGKLVDDQLTASLSARIKVKSVKLFGALPLFSENTCQSKSLSKIDLKSTGPFDPTGVGGTIGGTFAISDLNGCGLLGGIVSPLTAGGGNTITAKLTPKS